MASKSGHRAKKKGPRYTVLCRCGHEMRVRTKHFGRMCRCTQCDFPIYVTYENVKPPVDPGDKQIPKFYGEFDVPVRWDVWD